MIIKCKYCRANTEHIINKKIEKNGLKGIVVKCVICKYEKAIIRQPNGQMKMDDSKVPERTIILQHDKDYIMSDTTTQEEENARKEIDEWMVNKDKWPGFGKGKN